MIASTLGLPVRREDWWAAAGFALVFLAALAMVVISVTTAKQG